MKKVILALAATSLVFGATAASAQPYRDRDHDGIPNARDPNPNNPRNPGLRDRDRDGGREQRGHVEIAVLRRGRADTDAFIRKADVHRVGVGGGMDRHGRNAEFLARAQHAQGNLAAIGNQDLVKHRVCLVPLS